MTAAYTDRPPPLMGITSQFKYPEVDYNVIIETLTNMGVQDVVEKDLKNPNQQVAFSCFSAFLEILSYVSHSDIVSQKLDCIDRMKETGYQVHTELYDDSLNFLIFFREMRALMMISLVNDFTISDITRPKPKRFKQQMSALINFLRFSNEREADFDEVVGGYKSTIEKKKRLAEENAVIRAEIERHEAIRKEQEGPAAELREVNATLTRQLKELQDQQKALRQEYEDKKMSTGVAKARCEALKREYEAMKIDIEKLKMRLEDNPTQLREMNENTRRRLREKEIACSEEEAKAKIMAKKKQVLEGLEEDIAECSALVKSALEEKAKLDKTQHELAKIRKEKAEMVEERDNLTVQLEQSRQKLQFAMERLEKSQRNIEMKRDENKKKIEQTNRRWQEAQREKRIKIEKAEEINGEIAKLEAEYDKITRDFDSFYASLNQQKETLEKQTRVYMQAIAQRMDLQLDVL